MSPWLAQSAVVTFQSLTVKTMASLSHESSPCAAGHPQLGWTASETLGQGDAQLPRSRLFASPCYPKSASQM